MTKVLLLDQNKQPLMPCSQARARELLTKGKAAVFKTYPFVIILLERIEGDVQDIEIKIDPGSKTTGIALVGHFLKGRVALWASNLQHRGDAIRGTLASRRAIRRGRRHRKTRYRPARFDNRLRKEGWIAPSLQSRVDNIASWVNRLQKLTPLSSMVIETVRFDTQKIQNPEISGTEYQQGELMGYEIREYLLEKWGRKCAYCQAENTRLEIDHIVPKSLGGSNRVANLIICCHECNVRKGNTNLQEFLKNKPDLQTKLLKKAKEPLKDAAAVTSTRYATPEALRIFGLHMTFCSGGMTKFNRIGQGYEKDHWIDSICLGETGSHVQIPDSFSFFTIKATGRGSRQYCRMDRYGFPRTSAKSQKQCHGFKTGDLVKASVPKGKKQGRYFGRVAVRSSGNFCIDTQNGKVDGISHKHCINIQRQDGYNYSMQQFNKRSTLPPRPKEHSVIHNF